MGATRRRIGCSGSKRATRPYEGRHVTYLQRYLLRAADLSATHIWPICYALLHTGAPRDVSFLVLTERESRGRHVTWCSGYSAKQSHSAVWC
eukprot:2738313-Rhodomonas_salina.1